jgi:S1-C subfamily serine protease
LVAAGMLGGGVMAAALLGAGAVDRDVRTVFTGSAAGGASGLVAQPAGAPSVREVYRRAAPGVVLVRARTVQAEASPFDFSQRAGNVATASGFVLDDEGHLLTNAHVVAGATDIRVTFSEDETVPARVMGKDEATDLAVLAVEPGGLDLHPLELGSSKTVEIGDPTVAIGNPFGLDRTLTTGVVSAKQRRITAPSGFSIDNVIQTDAAVNPANSGGPLLDAAGRVIGINSQIVTARGPEGSVGIGFAVPIDTAKAIIPALEAHRTVSRAYLGIRGEPAADALVSIGDDRTGVLVEDVAAGAPAARAGILDSDAVAGGDVITAIEGEPVESMTDIDGILDRHRPGDGVAIDLVRDGRELKVQVQLGERPASVPMG